MDATEEDGSFCSTSPSCVVTAAPGKAILDTKQQLSTEQYRDDEFLELTNGVLSLEERLAPLGQASEGEDEVYYDEKWSTCDASPGLAAINGSDGGGLEYLRQLQDEQEQLNNALHALTSHFAQVQFRLKQIIDAPSDNKQTLLKELEEFAFRGVPDLREPTDDSRDVISPMAVSNDEVMEQQRRKQQELMSKLRSQLQELETYAYETGDGGLPSNILLERQNFILQQLKARMALNLEEIGALSSDELKEKIVNPAKVKEQLVEQLRTQVSDLERYIDFLHNDHSMSPTVVNANCSCTCDSHTQGREPVGTDTDTTDEESASGCRKHPPRFRRPVRRTTSEEERRKQARIIERMASIMQLFAVLHFGSCGSRAQTGNQGFRSNAMKSTPKGNHWGDIRAKLELAIEKVLREVDTAEARQSSNSDYASESDESHGESGYNEQLTAAVRKGLAGSLRDLLQHGLESGSSRSLLPTVVGCFATRPGHGSTPLHIWDLILKYYFFKNGPQYNATPARKLSESFNLNIVNGVSSKKTLLGVIHNIVCSHTPLRRSADTHFKAFVCAALNEKRLVAWLKMILRCKPIVERHFAPWSYLRKTGFEDALRSLDRLTSIHFNLPVDLAVKQLQEMHEAF
ncbi:RUN domain-containing protein 1-like [Tropilaelaps mercedesae]|uniref:RUN domain-containing protein 1-like n=1 Tax=Tropilaelaps mercedesae TaxID=418985 RepID=A0A1V9XMK9_9ACAR|nr:RUN domain-containing protein 1-like [Tropilaelaps mercedesae]